MLTTRGWQRIGHHWRRPQPDHEWRAHGQLPGRDRRHDQARHRDRRLRRDQATSSTSTAATSEETAQVFVDYINENGGIGGRKIEPVYKKLPADPGPAADPLSLCTAWTEDDEVFAVLGVFIDFTGDGQLCLTTDHETIHIGHELEQPWIDESPPGLLLTPDTTKESAGAECSSTCSSEEGKLEGKTVGCSPTRTPRTASTTSIAPGLEDAKVKTGSTAMLNITGTDTVGGAGPARQLHREVEDRGRRHDLHGRAQRARRSSSSRRSRRRCRTRC